MVGGEKKHVRKFKVNVGMKDGSSQRGKKNSSPERSESSFEELPNADNQAPGITNLVSSIWDNQFDVGMVPADCLHEILQAAPFMYGRCNACYTTPFFKKTLGLCDTGISFSKLSSPDLFPLEDLEATYPVVNGRHPVQLIKKEAREQALSLHQRVFGGPPDNGEFSTSFIRGCAFFYQRNKSVNWAAKAASLANGRAKHPERNLQKLTPPAIREQIQRMIVILSKRVVRAHNTYKEKSVLVASSSKAESEIDISSIVPSQRPVHVNTRHRSASRQSALPTVASLSPCVADCNVLPPLQAARAERDSLEKRLYKMLEMLEDLEKGLADHQAARTLYEEKEACAWDLHAEVRYRLKEAGASGNVNEKSKLDLELRRIQRKAGAASELLDAEVGAIDTTLKIIASQRRQVDTLQSTIGAMTLKIEELIIESIFVRPKLCQDLLPANRIGMDGLKVALPCACCNRYFADRACVPMSCGCLFHPHCLLKTVLAARAECPICKITCTGTWMAQWGHPLDSTMEANIEATRATLATLGWQPGAPIPQASTQPTSASNLKLEQPTSATDLRLGQPTSASDLRLEQQVLQAADMLAEFPMLKRRSVGPDQENPKRLRTEAELVPTVAMAKTVPNIASGGGASLPVRECSILEDRDLELPFDIQLTQA